MKKNDHLQKLVRQLVGLSFKDGKIVELQATKAIKALKSLPKYEALEGLSEYLKNLKRLQRQHTLYIETVIPLDIPQLKKIKQMLEKKAMPEGKQLKITKVITNINSEILGGFRLKVGDEVWDETLIGKINQIQEVIINGRSN